MENLPASIAPILEPLFERLPLERALDVLLPQHPQDLTVADLTGLPPLLQSAVWLYLDDLDRSHTISQSIESPEGAYWHGIMHRREGDFWNSKYWFRRAGSLPARLRLDPASLTDAFERVPQGENPPPALVEAQRHEWRTLFEHCAQGVL